MGVLWEIVTNEHENEYKNQQQDYIEQNPASWQLFPIGIQFNHIDPGTCGYCHFSGPGPGPIDGELKFFNGKVECASCHEPHNNGPTVKMLRISNTGSQLCLVCHGK